MQTQPAEDLQEREQSDEGLYESDPASDKDERGVQEYDVTKGFFGSWNCECVLWPECGGYGNERAN
jgi:hypothetical protein